MDNELEVIRDRMAETRSSLADKLEALETKVLEPVEAVSDAVTDTAETVQETIETVRHSLDLRHHAAKRPWVVMAGAVATGFIGDRLLLPGRRASKDSAAAGQNGHGGNHEAAVAQPMESEPGEEPDPVQRFLRKLKEQAIGTLMGTLRDLALRAFPESISADTRRFMDDLTVRIGGRPVSSDTHQQTSPSDGASH